MTLWYGMDMERIHASLYVCRFGKTIGNVWKIDFYISNGIPFGLSVLAKKPLDTQFLLHIDCNMGAFLFEKRFVWIVRVA